MFWFSLMVALILAAWLATKVHDFFSGRRILGDLCLEFLIMRSDFAALDAFCRSNPSRSNVIVSLTSLPSRLPMIADTMKSLLRQTRAPEEIRLYLPKFSKREQKPYAVPEFLRTLKSVSIFFCDDDYGPATKFLPALENLMPDKKLLVVDDDRIFQPDMLEILDNAANANAEAAYGLGGWIVPPDLVDRDTTIIRYLRDVPPVQVRPTRIRKKTEVDILMGAHSFIVRPRFFDLAQLKDYSGAPPAAFFADDIWLSAHCNVPKYTLPARRADFQPYRNVRAYDRSSLGWVNRVGDPERWINTVMLKYFGPAPWRVGAGKQTRPTNRVS